jgi:hypothetical protein
VDHRDQRRHAGAAGDEPHLLRMPATQWPPW